MSLCIIVIVLKGVSTQRNEAHLIGRIVLAVSSLKPPAQRVLESFPLGKSRPERDADHSPPSTAEIVNE
jgi:hypothetical protein